MAHASDANWRCFIITGPVSKWLKTSNKVEKSVNTKIISDRPMKSTFEILVDTQLTKKSLELLVMDADAVEDSSIQVRYA